MIQKITGVLSFLAWGYSVSALLCWVYPNINFLLASFLAVVIIAAVVGINLLSWAYSQAPAPKIDDLLNQVEEVVKAKEELVWTDKTERQGVELTAFAGEFWYREEGGGKESKALCLYVIDKISEQSFSGRVMLLYSDKDGYVEEKQGIVGLREEVKEWAQNDWAKKYTWHDNNKNRLEN